MPELSDLRGIGPATATVLAEHGIGTVSKLARAGVDALVAVPGFGADNVTVVATGSLAPLVYDECASLTDHHPYLTLDGLRRVHERSKSDPRARR